MITKTTVRAGCWLLVYWRGNNSCNVTCDVAKLKCRWSYKFVENWNHEYGQNIASDTNACVWSGGLDLFEENFPLFLYDWTFIRCDRMCVSAVASLLLAWLLSMYLCYEANKTMAWYACMMHIRASATKIIFGAREKCIPFVLFFFVWISVAQLLFPALSWITDSELSYPHSKIPSSPKPIHSN